MYLIVKIILLSSLLRLTLSVPATGKTQYFVHRSFNSTFQLLNGISNDLRKLPKCFNSIAIVTFLKIPLSVFALG